MYLQQFHSKTNHRESKNPKCFWGDAPRSPTLPCYIEAQVASLPPPPL